MRLAASQQDLRISFACITVISSPPGPECAGVIMRLERLASEDADALEA